VTTRSSSPLSLDWIGFVLIALCLGVVQINLLAAQGVLFSAAAIVWLVVVVRDRPRMALPAFMLPLGVYAFLTLVSCVFSGDPKESFIDSRQLLMFLMVPIVAHFVRGHRATQAIDIIIAIGAAGALVGIVQFSMFGYDNLTKRPVGALSHWMTYSGVLMLVTCAAVARLIFSPVRKMWPTVAVPALLVALVVTNTRNAWIGAFLAISCLLAIKNWRLVIIAPILAALAFAVAPGEVQRRANSMLNPTDPASRDRIVMWKIGGDMVRDHPLFGVGPERVSKVYESYREKYPEAVNKVNPHLHNVPIQIAAERGLPALAAWLWFVAAALWSLWRQLRAGVAPAVAAAGLAAVIAMLAAGLFEYNFGDSEFLMLFLGLITLPFAAARRDPSVSAAAVPRG
jgi:putative inorganic carbon (HCO3(-)) transporter